MDNAFRNIFANSDGSFDLEIETSHGPEIVLISKAAAETIESFIWLSFGNN